MTYSQGCYFVVVRATKNNVFFVRLCFGKNSGNSLQTVQKYLKHVKTKIQKNKANKVKLCPLLTKHFLTKFTLLNFLSSFSIDFIKETTNKLLCQALSALCWQQSSIKIKTCIVVDWCMNYGIRGKFFFSSFLKLRL